MGANFLDLRDIYLQHSSVKKHWDKTSTLSTTSICYWIYVASQGINTREINERHTDRKGKVSTHNQKESYI